MSKFIISTPRLILRPLKSTDFKKWQESNSLKSPSKNKWDKGIEPDSNFTRSNFNKILSDQKVLRDRDTFYTLNIFDKKTGNIIGTTSAMNVLRSVSHTCFLGYFLNNNYWGMGYGKEAVQAMIHFCFKELKLHRIEAGIEPTNRRSILLAKSLGLRKEGLKKRIVFLRNDWRDLTMYSATCEEFGYKWKKS
jgi:[ribosomal protein S5]-alanine N-acetyltransferase